MAESRIISQRDCNPHTPEEHFLWALTRIPFSEKISQPIQTRIAQVISKHLWSLSFRHMDHIRRLANEDGWIHVNQLPEQQKFLRMPARGQHQNLNGAAVWVDIGEPENPEPVQIPDVRKMTRQEQELMQWELEQAGVRRPEPKDHGKVGEITSYAARKAAHVKTAEEARDGRNAEPGPS
jgi:hypothetical protein